MRKFIIDGFQSLLCQFTNVTKLLILALLFTTLGACQNNPSKQTTEQKTMAQEKPITDGFYTLLSDKPVKLNIPLKEIFLTKNRPQDLSKAVIEPSNGSRRQFINEELNSRLPVLLKGGDWTIKWKTDLSSSFAPFIVLEAHDRIIVEGDGVWFLFDQNGKKIKNGQLGSSHIILDDENFYAADSTGMIWARRLTDGADVFGLSLAFGDEFERTFMFRKGQKFLAVSTEHELDLHKPETKENSLIELVDLGNSLKTDADTRLTSSKPLANLVRKTKLLLSAAHHETLLFATENRVYQTDLNLEIERALTGDFSPLAMSLDESGRIYLTVKQKNNYFLWRLQPTGELTLAMELPSGFIPSSTPPMIGYDYNIYLVGDDRLLAVDPLGKLIWQSRDLEKKISGAVITANDQLLVSAENELLVFDPKDRPRPAFTLSDELLSGAPILTMNGEILLTTTKHLYCLTSN